MKKVSLVGARGLAPSCLTAGRLCDLSRGKALRGRCGQPELAHMEVHSVERVAVESDAATLTKRVTEKPGTNPRLHRGMRA